MRGSHSTGGGIPSLERGAGSGTLNTAAVTVGDGIDHLVELADIVVQGEDVLDVAPAIAAHGVKRRVIRGEPDKIVRNLRDIEARSVPFPTADGAMNFPEFPPSLKSSAFSFAIASTMLCDG